MGKLGTFLTLGGTEKRAAIEALALVAWAQLLVTFIPPRRWRDRLLNREAPTGHANPAALRLVRQAVNRAARNIPTAPNCLPQALAARKMLARRGIASQLHIGTGRGQDGAHAFHAWLKVGDQWITGDCDESHYRLLN